MLTLLFHRIVRIANRIDPYTVDSRLPLRMGIFIFFVVDD
uniref:Uncharacterized protein n=1 Tax=Anguilla anguilla TaxID=7936 RepID=A0A0E9T8F7_ANGAN